VIESREFCAALREAGHDFFTGVPCSYLSGPLEVLGEDGDYVAAPNEGIALSVAAGSLLAGRRPVVLAQNSGLGNLLDPLTSLVMAYRLPVLLVVSLRGWPDPSDDEPHHEVMGRSTVGVLDAVGVGHRILDGSAAGLRAALAEAEEARRAGAPFVLLVPKAALSAAAVGPGTKFSSDEVRFRREDAVRVLAAHLGGATVVSTTGMISRELFGARDLPSQFYMQGSMGHAVGLALGAAEALPDRRVVLLDGDGAALMHLGGLALVGERAPGRLLHVLLDNGVYDSTGGQPTRLKPVPWGALAEQLGYRRGWTCQDAEGFDAALSDARNAKGPVLVAAQVEPGGDTVPPRITSRWTNPQVAARFRAAVTNEGGHVD